MSRTCRARVVVLRNGVVECQVGCGDDVYIRISREAVGDRFLGVRKTADDVLSQIRSGRTKADQQFRLGPLSRTIHGENAVSRRRRGRERANRGNAIVRQSGRATERRGELSRRFAVSPSSLPYLAPSIRSANIMIP